MEGFGPVSAVVGGIVVVKTNGVGVVAMLSTHWGGSLPQGSPELWNHQHAMEGGAGQDAWAAGGLKRSSRP